MKKKIKSVPLLVRVVSQGHRSGRRTVITSLDARIQQCAETEQEREASGNISVKNLPVDVGAKKPNNYRWIRGSDGEVMVYGFSKIGDSG